MRVAMYYNNHDVRVEELPVPEIGAGELLVKVEASGICGSDVMEWYRIQKAPTVLGHEVAGTIVQAGAGVERFKEGDNMIVTHHVPCNACHYCLSGHHTVCATLRETTFEPGGFSEYLRVPAINVDRGVFTIPASLSFDEASFAEPWLASTGASAARTSSLDRPSSSWAVDWLGCCTSTWHVP